MTIKDIAQLAGVSISTVSKIMNGKDSSISPATREKVLTIIKEHNYVPYSAVSLQHSSKTLMLGLLLRSAAAAQMMEGIITTAQTHGYTVLVCESSGSTENELKNITTLCRHNVDGILWEPVKPKSLEYARHFAEARIPYQIFNTFFYGRSFNIDFVQAAYTAVEMLIRKKHTDIACLLDQHAPTGSFLDGYKKCLFDNQIAFDENKVCSFINDSLIHKITNHQISGIVTSDYPTALELYETLYRLHFDIPYDISLISLRYDTPEQSDYPHISTIVIPYHDYGSQLCLNMINYIELSKKLSARYYTELHLKNTHTIGIPYNLNTEKILVVGSINIDCYMKVDELPMSGKATITSSFHSYPGGKGINEAIGASKLGARVSLIGAVGNDIESEVILSSLNEYNVDNPGVYRTADSVTGKAYIYLNRAGESMISILSGANQLVTPDMVEQQESLFDNTSYCLLPTEIPMNTVLTAAKLARKHGAQTILKPSASPHLSDELLAHTDILVPNRNEINTLCPDLHSLEEQANYFLMKGVETIIITLGSDGCYLKTGEISRYFPACDFQPIDNTGAADAFISAFAVYLQKGYELSAAIRIATYAAGFSISREGVVPALIDANALESYINQKEPELFEI